MNKTRKYDGKKKCAAAVRMEKLLGLHCPENHKDNKNSFEAKLPLFRRRGSSFRHNGSEVDDQKMRHYGTSVTSNDSSFSYTTHNISPNYDSFQPTKISFPSHLTFGHK